MDGMDGTKKPRRRKVKRFTAERRAAYLAHLRRTGNGVAAAKAIGMHRDCAEQRRKRDAAFALDCAAAEAEAARTLAGAKDCFDGVDDPARQIIKRGPHGRTMIVATRRGKWSKKVEAIFLDALRMHGNISAAARAAGVSTTLIWTRRRDWPAFRERFEEALEEAEVALEFRLAFQGNMILNEAPPGEQAGTGAAGEPAAEPAKFDPDLALRFLKWRQQKKTGRDPRRGRHKGPPDRSIEEAVDSILRKVEAIERHRARKKLAEGWQQDENGYMIPPGWVRGGPAAGEEEVRDAQD
jgi:molybdenum-dependent DNA-binding transcriptional regulator ModE